MTLQFTPELLENKTVYISESGSIIEPDGYNDYHGHKNFSSADILANYFTYHVTESNVFGSLTGKNKKEILKELVELQDSLKGNSHDSFEKMKLDLVELLINCYKGRRFDLSLGITLNVLNLDEFRNTSEYRLLKGTDDEKYRTYLNKCVTSQFKDIMISYLGYDATEIKEPKTISTSSLRINERFYNYLLMDYKIVKMKRFRYDPVMKKYVISKDEYFVQEKEEMLDNEIRSLKLKFPHMEDRVQFFK